MGREATCQCQWGTQSARCKVLLETTELIVRELNRGALRHTVPIASLTKVEVLGDQLKLRAGKDHVVLNLGAELAQSWAQKIVTPPPTLAKKLGLTPSAKILLIGEPESEELQAALAESAAETGEASAKTPEQIVACLHTEAELGRALARITAHPSSPVWIIYPKGAKSSLPEAAVRNTLRSQGFIDTKVASVSPTLTALRFIRRA
jgi:hypothetical protein